MGAAEQALRAGRYAEAERGFLRLRTGPRGGRAWLGLGRLQLQTGRYGDAIKSAQAALKAGAPEHRAATLMGEAYYATGKLAEAQRSFEQAVRAPDAFRARVLLGRMLIERGRYAEAEPHLMAVIEAYNEDRLPTEPPRDHAEGLLYTAMAARALGSMHDANDAFREAALADRKRAETQLEWASLFLEKYDQRHAAESVEEALQNNPNHPVAHALMARLELARSYDFPAVREHLDKAQAINPNLPMAEVTRAAMALRNMDIDVADEHLDRALAIRPNDLEALSVRAAARFLADDAAGFERAKRAVLERNPRFSRMYSIIGEYAEWEHRYADMATMAREALAIDGDDPLAYAMLGINLLRLGDEDDGLAALRAAWERDRFNVHVFNTLNLYEDVISKDYVTFEAPPFRIRMLREERAGLEPYLVPMLTRAYDDMRKRYRFVPEGPLQIELYADTRHFSVRTTGLPNVGVQGVCFGKVVTALSPRGGPFNWGQITWHELAHVFHLQLSKNHVPRWFTEGLAEYETVIARVDWRREEDHNLWLALKTGRVPPLRELNRAFTSARSPDDLMTAYYVASQVVAYIVERFGFEKVRPMLVAWGKGERTAEVVRKVLAVDIEQLDKDFREHTARRLARYDGRFHVDFARFADLEALEAAAKRAPRDADALSALATGYVIHDRFDDAERVGKQALSLSPQHALANFALTRVALERGDVAQAESFLRAIVEGGQDGYIVRVLLARAALAARRPGQARVEAEAARALDPEQPEAFRILLDVAEKVSDKNLARRALTALVNLDQHDRAIHFGLMTILYRDEDWDELVRVGEKALYIDPESPQLHFLLGEGYTGVGEPRKAIVELDRALALGHPKRGKVELARVRAFTALGQMQRAREAAGAATASDPTLRDRARKILGD